jgi:hypothetical protein
MVIFFAKFTLPKNNGSIIFLITLAYSQIVKSFLSQYDKLCKFSKKKKKNANFIRMGVHSLNELLVSFEGYFSPLLDDLTKQPHYSVSSGSSKHITAPTIWMKYNSQIRCVKLPFQHLVCLR